MKAGREWGWRGGAEAEKTAWPAMSTEDTSSLGQYLPLKNFLNKNKKPKTCQCPVRNCTVGLHQGPEITIRPCQLPPQPPGDLELLPPVACPPPPHLPILQSRWCVTDAQAGLQTNISRHGSLWVLPDTPRGGTPGVWVSHECRLSGYSKA